jgi:hypothetical protein
LFSSFFIFANFKESFYDKVFFSPCQDSFRLGIMLDIKIIFNFMEEQQQIQYQPEVKPKSGMVKMIMINIVVSALVSVIVFFIVVFAFNARISALDSRTSVLEQKMDKISNKIIVR